MADAKKTAKKVVKSDTGVQDPPAQEPRDITPGAKDHNPGSTPEGHECAGCEFFYDSYKNPAVVGENRTRERKGSRIIKQEMLCCHPSPSEDVSNGKKINPCPGHGESVGRMQLTPEEVELIHQRRLKEGKVKTEKQN